MTKMEDEKMPQHYIYIHKCIHKRCIFLINDIFLLRMQHDSPNISYYHPFFLKASAFEQLERDFQDGSQRELIM